MNQSSHAHLTGLRQAVLWKAQGLDESALRRPMTATGTNLLGLVKHLAACEWGWFGMCFGRPVPDLPHLRPGADRLLDFYATFDETAEQVLQDYRDAVAAADATLAELGPGAVGHIVWWDGREVTMEQALLQMTIETARHLGHMDIVREQLDGRAGLAPDGDLLTSHDDEFWRQHVEMLRTLAKRAEVGALPADD